MAGTPSVPGKAPQGRKGESACPVLLFSQRCKQRFGEGGYNPFLGTAVAELQVRLVRVYRKSRLVSHWRLARRRNRRIRSAATPSQREKSTPSEPECAFLEDQRHLADGGAGFYRIT